MAGWGDLFGKISQQFQGRLERIKNEKARLIDERKKLVDGPCTASSTERVTAIDLRLSAIQEALSNAAKD